MGPGGPTGGMTMGGMLVVPWVEFVVVGFIGRKVVVVLRVVVVVLRVVVRLVVRRKLFVSND